MSEELTRTITREQAEEWGLPRDLYEDGASHADAATEIARERLDEHRWYVVKRVIFTAPDDGLTWAAEYCEGLSEVQEDTDPWYRQPAGVVEITRYEQHEKTVTAWRPVGSEPAPVTAGDGQQADGRPAARVACEAFWAALHAPDSGTVHPDAAWAWAQTMGARHAWEAAVIAITALDGPAYAQLRSSLASQVAENARLSAELERHHIALSSIARVNHAHDDGKLSATEAIDLVDSELSAFATEDGAKLDRPEAAPVVVTWDPRECTTTYIDEIAEAVKEQSGGRVIITMTDIADSDCHAVIGPREYTDDEALELLDAEAGEDPTNRDVDPGACDAVDRDDFGDSE